MKHLIITTILCCLIAQAAVATDTVIIGDTTAKAGGGLTSLSVPLPEKIVNRIQDKDRDHKDLRVSLCLPKGFDATKPQKYLLISRSINKPKDLAKGNIATIGRFKREALASGWVIFCIDTNAGYPATNQFKEIILFGLETMEKAIPAFAKSTFATAGSSGGAKSSAYCSGALVKRKYNLVGMFMSGCNEDRLAKSRKEFRASKSGYKNTKVFMSSGKKDKVAPPSMVKGVASLLRSSGVGEIRIESHEGGHGLHKAHITQALEWFESK